MQECKEYIERGVGLDWAGGTQALKFARHRSAPGDGVLFCVYICKSHKDCQFVARGVKTDSTFWVQADANQQHTKDIRVAARKNSTFTREQQEAVVDLIDSGARPAAILSSLTAKELQRCSNANKTPMKRATGGLAGACPDQ